MVEAAPNKVIVVSAAGTELGVQLRNQDMSWNEFLSTVHDLPRYYCMFFLQIMCVCFSSKRDLCFDRSENLSPAYQPMDSVTNILFSSGTTGQKVIYMLIL